MRDLLGNGLVITALAVAAPAVAAESSVAINTASPSVDWGACPPVFAKGCQIAVLHGDPAKPNADMLLRVPGGFRIAPHRHSSAERMILVSGRLRVRYQGEAARLLTPGTYAFGPAGVPHEAACLPGPRCVLFIAFEGPVDADPVEGPIR